MKREIIRSCPSWRGARPRHDCAFVTTDPDVPGMRGMDVVHILAFFSFTLRNPREARLSDTIKQVPCAVVRWFVLSDEPNQDTGMWVVRPGYNTRRQPDISIIHLDSIYRAAHLIPVYGTQHVSPEIQPHNSYNSFRSYYVNKYADHHAFEIAS